MDQWRRLRQCATLRPSSSETAERAQMARATPPLRTHRLPLTRSGAQLVLRALLMKPLPPLFLRRRQAAVRLRAARLLRIRLLRARHHHRAHCTPSHRRPPRLQWAQAACRAQLWCRCLSGLTRLQHTLRRPPQLLKSLRPLVRPLSRRRWPTPPSRRLPRSLRRHPCRRRRLAALLREKNGTGWRRTLFHAISWFAPLARRQTSASFPPLLRAPPHRSMQ